ncbi:hypothetical protein SLS60_011934 [Paraconiothyrium brasiliense]|uniref:Uncharacterized protein n=1 Tax=Paraconiothyrium brasiliense TaxID=300254 RepID=A0ABR3QGZ9_9PLEO
MAALKSDPDRQHAKTDADASAAAASSPLARVMREFEDLVLRFETGLLRSLEPELRGRRDHVRREACRLAVAELGTRYTKLQIRRSLSAAEAQGRRVEQLLHAALDAGSLDDDGADDLRGIHHGYFRLYSTELFDMLGQPVDLRLGTVRFHHCHADPLHTAREPDQGPVSLELALGSSFFVADALETLPFHAFKVPQRPSLQNRGILSRKPDDHGAFPDYDSWLLFTFLGNGCLKLEVPIEMCADVYGGPLRGRENEEVHFWGVFVDDDAP